MICIMDINIIRLPQISTITIDILNTRYTSFYEPSMATIMSYFHFSLLLTDNSILSAIKMHFGIFSFYSIWIKILCGFIFYKATIKNTLNRINFRIVISQYYALLLMVLVTKIFRPQLMIKCFICFAPEISLIASIYSHFNVSLIRTIQDQYIF